MEIKLVTTANDRRCFVDLPTQLHAGNANWSPGLLHDDKRLLGFSSGHPFPRENTVQCWLAYRQNEVVGRVAAIKLALADRQATKASQFGFLAVRDDTEAAKALIATAARWAVEQGMQELQGPFSPSINYSVGMLQSGFDREPSFQLPCNPNYYPALMERVGLRPLHELYALEIRDDDLVTSTVRLERVAECLRRRKGVTFRSMDPWRRRRDLELFLSIAQQSLQTHWGFVPLSKMEKRQLMSDMGWVVHPSLLQFAEVDGKAVGASLALPDFSPTIKQIGGKLLPFGFLQLLRARKKCSRYRLVAANILPDYQRMGLAPALVGRIMRNVIHLGSRRVEFSWIAESNALSFGTIENGGAVRTKTMQIYHANCADLAG